MSPVDWRSTEPVLLLNPRLPNTERAAYENAWQRELKRRKEKRLTTDLIGLATSGTSGALKLVLLTRSAFLASAQAVNEHLESSVEDTWLKALPDFHVGGLSIFARAFITGATVVESKPHEGVWSASAFTEEVKHTKATLVSLVPAQVFSIVQSKVRAPDSLQAAVIGGGALANDLYMLARELRWPVLPSYGLTECCSQVATALLGTTRRAGGEMPRPHLLSHIKARVSETGKLELKSPALLEGYIKIKGGESLFEDPKRDGWFETEDRVELIDDELVVLGRDSDFLKIGGESVDFARLQSKFEDLRIFAARLNELPDFALIAVPDPRLGQVIHLLCASSGVAPRAVENLVESFNQEVLPFERIRQVHMLANIPRSSLGKLLKQEALDLIQV